MAQSPYDNKRPRAVSGLCRYILLGILLFPAVGTAQAPSPAIENSSAGLYRAITDRSPQWRLQGLALPSRAQPVDIDFEEVQVFATDSALVTEKGGKFIRRPREAIRVFVGKPADTEFNDDIVILVARANGELQGRWHGRQGDFELRLRDGDAALRADAVPLPEIDGNPFLDDEVPVPDGTTGPISRAALEAQRTGSIASQSLAPGEVYTATIAIDTDFELVQQLGSVGNVSAYMASLFAYLNTTYEDEISTRLLIGDQIIPATAGEDPYGSWTGCGARLGEVESRYAGNSAINRALLAHFSPSGASCGIAYSPVPNGSAVNGGGVLCDVNYGFSVNNITGTAPNSSTPISSSWDAIVAAHELGHNFNSPHAHCYGNLNGSGLTNSASPVDSCYVAETPITSAVNSCASGSAQLPGNGSLTGGSSGAADGTIMSYCHLLSGGLSNIDRTFGAGHSQGIAPARVSERMARAVENAFNYSNTCIGTSSTSAPTTWGLTVSKSGAGSGTVTSSPSGISCGSTCTQDFAVDTSVTLTASADAGSEFAGWSGDCSGTGSCAVTMTANRSVQATFTALPSPALGTAVEAEDLTWTTGGDANWAGQFVEFVPAGANDDSAQAGAITHNQSSYMETQVTGAGILSFYWRVSSEANYDFLEVYLDGTRQSRISGNTSWAQVTLNITGSGTHTVRWVYDKDYSVDSLSDTGWVDQVSWQGPPDAPSLTGVTTAQTSASTASATVTFTPAPTSGSPDSFMATCTPQSSPRQASLSAPSYGDVLADEAGLPAANPTEQEQEALRLFHSSEEFHDNGLRCDTDGMQQRLPDVDYGASVSPDQLASDCTNGFTSISSAYNPVAGANYVIPVVFHVIYRSDNVGYITNQRIQDQMAVLNEDFAGFLGTGVNSGIQFVLMGINYYQNDTAFQDASAGSFKASIALPETQYLNVFTNDASGYLGYATLPDGAAGGSGDGVVMLHSTIGGRNNGYGNFDEGRTLVHEVGHYLGLHHTFNPSGACQSNTYSAGDYIVDTPAQLNPDFGSGSSDCGSASDFDNFMNYSYDRFMDTFTAEQTNRMICSLTSYRASAYTLVYDNGAPVSASGSASPLTMTGLEAGTTYDCAVTALIGSTESGPSSSITILAGDSDGDGALDYDDAFPDDPTETTDTDGDGLGDNLELVLGTDINNVDTDGDSYSDYEEYNEGSDPLDADDTPQVPGLPIWLLYEATQP